MSHRDPLWFEVGGGYTARHLVNMLQPSAVDDPSPADVLAAALVELRDLRAASEPKTQPSAALVAIRAVEYARGALMQRSPPTFIKDHAPLTFSEADKFLTDMLSVLSKHIHEG